MILNDVVHALEEGRSGILLTVTGVPREKLVGTDFSDYFTEPEKAREGYQQVFAKGFVTDYPLTIRHKDGRFTDVLYNASVYRDAQGTVLGVFAAARDVTESKRVMKDFAETKNGRSFHGRNLRKLRADGTQPAWDWGDVLPVVFGEPLNHAAAADFARLAFRVAPREPRRTRP